MKAYKRFSASSYPVCASWMLEVAGSNTSQSRKLEIGAIPGYSAQWTTAVIGPETISQAKLTSTTPVLVTASVFLTASVMIWQSYIHPSNRHDSITKLLGTTVRAMIALIVYFIADLGLEQIGLPQRVRGLSCNGSGYLRLSKESSAGTGGLTGCAVSETDDRDASTRDDVVAVEQGELVRPDAEATFDHSTCFAGKAAAHAMDGKLNASSGTSERDLLLCVVELVCSFMHLIDG